VNREIIRKAFCRPDALDYSEVKKKAISTIYAD